ELDLPVGEGFVEPVLEAVERLAELLARAALEHRGEPAGRGGQLAEAVAPAQRQRRRDDLVQAGVTRAELDLEEARDPGTVGLEGQRELQRDAVAGAGELPVRRRERRLDRRGQLRAAVDDEGTPLRRVAAAPQRLQRRVRARREPQPGEASGELPLQG